MHPAKIEDVLKKKKKVEESKKKKKVMRIERCEVGGRGLLPKY